MKRITLALSATTCAVLFAATAIGCGGGDGGGGGERREVPTEKVAAPGSQIGAPDQAEEGTPPEGD